ncbi:MAG: phosphoadenosine phosphosulfate reductase family protein [Nitrospira sp.]|nr:phosphoadenosine phosphosulfate reductase family protein [Nitrospira sp.]
MFTGSKESTLLFHLLAGTEVPVIFIDTAQHFPEVYELVDMLKVITVIKADDVAAGPVLNRKLCCTHRKQDVLKSYMQDNHKEVLITPFRNTTEDRLIEASYISDTGGQVVRPLQGTSDRDIWLYIRQHGLSYSSTYRRGYMHPDCKACTSRHGIIAVQSQEQRTAQERERLLELKSLGYI